jgi:CRP-like cAMP-binding protein/membrane protease YdiL (CAAX protease family)
MPVANATLATCNSCLGGNVAYDITEIRELVAGNSLFNKFTDEQLDKLASIISETRTISAGDFLVLEGEQASEIFLIQSGELEVVKKEVGSDQHHVLAKLSAGMSVGEVSLLDAGPRSASVRALGEASALVIPIDELNKLSGEEQTLDVQMKINLAQEMGQRLRTTNEATVRTLREKLDEAEKRAEMGRFMGRVLIGTCLYMFTLGAMKSLSQYLPDTTMVTVPILLAFAASLAINIKTSIYPASAYGLTLIGWKPAVKEAILFSIPVLAIVVFVKWVLTLTLPSLEGADVLDFYRSKGATVEVMIISGIAYTIFAPIQEMIARSGMQSSFQMFLTGKHKTWLSIFLATLLFSSTHLHVSFVLALLVFPLGLFWGWMYSRQPNIIGVALSHVIIGLFGLFVVGFPTRTG